MFRDAEEAKQLKMEVFIEGLSIQEVLSRCVVNYKLKGETQMAPEKEPKKAKKELTEKQIENRRRQTVTVLRYGTMKDPEFWKQDFVPVDLFFETLTSMEEIKKTLREKKVEIKIAELKSLGLDIPANFKMKFND